MAYNQFTLEILETKFNLTIKEKRRLFVPGGPVAVGAWLRDMLEQTIPLALSSNSEKARSEFIIAPILTELRNLMEQRISIFSGVKFNVDAKQGLNGECDFIVSQGEQFYLKSPVVMLVEAKKEDLYGGLGQCVAEMFAAQIFNRQRARDLPVSGCVTSGTNWQFLRLDGDVVLIDPEEYSVENLENILGILHAACLSSGFSGSSHATR